MNITTKITTTAIFAALYTVLSFLTIKIGNVSITLAPLPILILVYMVGTLPAVAACLVGEFIIQVCLYGLTLTTPIWMIGPVLRPCVLSILIWLIPSIKEKSWKFILAAVFAGLCTTAGNTLALYLDALIIGYPFTFVVIETLIRTGVSIIASAIIGYIAFTSARILLKARPLNN